MLKTAANTAVAKPHRGVSIARLPSRTKVCSAICEYGDTPVGLGTGSQCHRNNIVSGLEPIKLFDGHGYGLAYVRATISIYPAPKTQVAVHRHHDGFESGLLKGVSSFLPSSRFHFGPDCCDEDDGDVGP